MGSLRFGILAVSLAALVACAPVPRSNDIVIDDSLSDVLPAPDVDSGLTEREPDTCGAEDLQTLLGQNESVIAGLGLTNPFRIVRPDSILTQEYNSARVNIRVNESGTVLRVSCG